MISGRQHSLSGIRVKFGVCPMETASLVGDVDCLTASARAEAMTDVTV